MDFDKFSVMIHVCFTYIIRPYVSLTILDLSLVLIKPIKKQFL